MCRVLVVGRTLRPSLDLSQALSREGFEVTTSSGDLTAALRAVLAVKPHALIINAQENEESKELFRLLRAICDQPILVLGGQQEQELLWYLESGASCFISYPTTPAYLSARLRALLRRTASANEAGMIKIGSLEIDLERYEVRRLGHLVPLTPTEFKLLKILALRAGHVCSHRSLLQEVWGDDFVNSLHYLRLYIGYLRHKLEEDPSHPQLLTTEWGVGYRLRDDTRQLARSATTWRSATHNARMTSLRTA